MGSDLDISGGLDKGNDSNHHKVLQSISDQKLWGDIEDLLEILKKLKVISELS